MAGPGTRVVDWHLRNDADNLAPLGDHLAWAVPPTVFQDDGVSVRWSDADTTGDLLAVTWPVQVINSGEVRMGLQYVGERLTRDALCLSVSGVDPVQERDETETLICHEPVDFDRHAGDTWTEAQRDLRPLACPERTTRARLDLYTLDAPSVWSTDLPDVEAFHLTSFTYGDDRHSLSGLDVWVR
ncbi:MAG: hypothetical protein H6739_28345 [Alphaproteobacteria bacterium]|nr:hypothetical protein [Alphaproteobacteria bacterium]